MSRLLAFWAVVLCGISYVSGACAQEYTDVAGFWLSPDENSVIEFYYCGADGAGICGKYHWLVDGENVIDEKNPDFAFQNSPLCQMEIMWGFFRWGANSWAHGMRYIPSLGAYRHSGLSIGYDESGDPNKLYINTYYTLPFLGTSQTWKRVGEKEFPQCSEFSGQKAFDPMEGLEKLGQ